MIKWTGTQPNGRLLVGLGVEEKNLEKLRQGDPIHIFGEEISLPFDIVIYYGNDMNALMRATQPGIGPDTIVHDTRDRKKQ